jgi:hypothetical protein
MFARAAPICGYTTGPALAITGGGSIHELQGFVLDVAVRDGRKGPDFDDLVVHESVCLLLPVERVRLGSYVFSVSKAFTRESDESGAEEIPSVRFQLPPGAKNYITRGVRTD